MLKLASARNSETQDRYHMNYGRALRMVRLARRLTQKELGEVAGVGQGYVSQIENGKRTPSLEVLEVVANRLEVSLHLIVLLASDEEDLRGISKEQAQVLGRELLNLHF
jgi:transcriptional regulator with XRE-family HTH domain